MLPTTSGVVLIGMVYSTVFGIQEQQKVCYPWEKGYDSHSACNRTLVLRSL